MELVLVYFYAGNKMDTGSTLSQPQILTPLDGDQRGKVQIKITDYLVD